MYYACSWIRHELHFSNERKSRATLKCDEVDESVLLHKITVVKEENLLHTVNCKGTK